MINWKSAYSEVLRGEVPNSENTMKALVRVHRQEGAAVGCKIMGKDRTPVEMTLSDINDAPKLGLMAAIYQTEVGGMNPYAELKRLVKEHKHLVVWDAAVLNG